MELELYCDKLIEKCKKMEVCESEAYGNYVKNIEILVSDGEITEYKIYEKENVHLIGTYQKGVGEYYTEDLDGRLIGKIVNIIKNIAENSENTQERNLFLYKGSGIKEKNICFEKKYLLKKVGEILDEIKICMREEPLTKFYEYRFIFSEEKRVIRNSRGLFAVENSDLGMLISNVGLEKGNHIESGFDVKVFKNISELNYKECIDILIKDIKIKFKKKNFKVGKQTTILGHKVMADLLASFYSVFCARDIDDSRNLLAGKEGLQVFSNLITIIDNPKEKYNRRAFDGEGVPTKKINIVAKGKLNTLMYNQVTAAKMGKKTTGHAIRELDGQMGIGPSNLYIEAGNTTLDEMMSDIHNGVLVTEIEDIYAGIDVITGNFSCPCEGLVIENGKISGATEMLVITGNFFDILKNVKSIGNDFDWRFVYGAYGSPSVVVEDIQIDNII